VSFFLQTLRRTSCHPRMGVERVAVCERLSTQPEVFMERETEWPARRWGVGCWIALSGSTRMLRSLGLGAAIEPRDSFPESGRLQELCEGGGDWSTSLKVSFLVAALQALSCCISWLTRGFGLLIGDGELP
jgi:hypothetical protein